MKQSIEYHAITRFVIGMLVSLSILLCGFIGCGKWTSPPDHDQIEDVFEANLEDFRMIADYLIDRNCDSFIDSADGRIFRCDTFSYEQINDKEIEKCIRRLLGKRIIIKASKNDNTVEFYMWGHVIQPIECGAAYSIDGSGKLDVQFMLRQEPLSELGWYYYYSDYNEWRVKQRAH